MNRPFELINPGLTRFRSAPRFGFQDVGISPAGPMDRLAVQTGNIMLGNNDFDETLEIILPPLVRCIRPSLYVLTGAHRPCLRKSKGKVDNIEQASVFFLDRGDELHFSQSTKGFRTVLSWRNVDNSAKAVRLCLRRRGDFSRIFTYNDSRGRIRLLPGPEWGILRNPRLFTDSPWRISSNSNEMGCRLSGPELNGGAGDSMISDAVADGTVQLTPDGPIILLYHRQTVGGYPRISHVISGDLDTLSQYSPGEHLRFKMISFDESRRINKLRASEIEAFRTRFSRIK